MFVVGDVAGEININSEMLFDDLAYLLTQSDIILFAQLVKDKFEAERVEIFFDQHVFFRMFFFDNGNNMFRFVERAVA